MSGVRIQVPGRFRSCSHLACFDLPTLVEVNRRARKWQCPHCLHNCSLDDLIIDPYFHRVLAIFSAEYDTDCTDLEIAPDGSWRAFLSGDAKKAAGGVQPRWHKPEETTYVPPPAEERPAVVVKKEDEGRRGSGILKIRLKRDRGDAQGAWQIERHANGDEERPAKLARIDADGGSSDHKSDVNKALATDEGGKGKTTVIDLSDSDDDDLVVAAPPADKKIANGWGGGAAAPVHGPAQHEARGLHDLLAAAAAADGPSESGGAPGSEGQPQSSPHTADAQPGGAAQGEEMWGRGGGGRYWGEARMQGLAEPRHPAGPPPLEGGFVAAPSFDTGVSAAFSLPCSPRFGAHPGDGAEAGRRLPSFVHSNSEVSRGPGFRRYAEPGRLERGGGEGLVPSWPPRKVTASSHPKGQRTNRTSSPARWGDFVGCSGADMYAAPAEQRNGFGGAGYGAASLGGGGATSGRQTDAVDPRNGFGGSNFDRYGGGGVGPSGADSHPPGFGPGECADTGAARGRPADFDPFPGGGLEDDTTWRGYLERERSPEQAGQAEHGAGGGDWFPGSGQFDAGGLDPGAGRDGGGRNGGRDGDNMDAWFRDTFGADDMGHFGGLEDSARGGLGAGGVWH